MTLPESPRAPAPTPLACLLTLALLALLLTGCAVQLPVPASESVPPLPAEARQPPTPSVCLPSCSLALKTLLESLMSAVQREQPASSHTMR